MENLERLYELIALLNGFDGTDLEIEKKIRDLVCFFLDDSQLMENGMYRNVIFEAAQKMRMFGYIKGDNPISQDEFKDDFLTEIKHTAIQKYYESKVYRNNILDKRQKDIIDTFMLLSKKRIIVSAPTSFGKTFLLREIIYLNRERYKNILLLFPTIALLNENTNSLSDVVRSFEMDYRIVNNIYSEIDPEQRHIFILTPERTLKLLADNKKLSIDFFFFDEVYKIDEDYSQNGDRVDDEATLQKRSHNRAKAFRIVLYLLAKNVKEYYLAGPYLNMDEIRSGMRSFIEKNEITVIQENFEPTTRIEIDAWKKNCIEHHPILGSEKIILYDKATPQKKDMINGIIKYIENNKLGQAIFYCAAPAKSMKYARDIVSEGFDIKNKNEHQDFIDHLRKRYRVNELQGIDCTKYWTLITALEKGIGIHHGKFPKYIQNEILRMFNDGELKYLFCTSTIIEGVNTNAKNVVIINNSVGTTTMTAFALKNIKGRAGRYYHHSMGRVFYTDAKQRQIEKNDDIKLNFQIYDDVKILPEDVDNSDVEDLIGENRNIKFYREESFDRSQLPDSVFVQNRLYPRDIQEKCLRFFLKDSVFKTFEGVLRNSNNIGYFINNKVVNKILSLYEEIGLLDTNLSTKYNAVVDSYSINGTMGVLRYHMLKLAKGDVTDDAVDAAYIKSFEEIRNIVEYEVPKLLCLFESLYRQAGIMKGYQLDDFDMSVVIRYFELGIKTELGMFLVEFGFPLDTVRSMEKYYRDIEKLDAHEAAAYIERSLEKGNRIFDSYEKQLFSRAVRTLLKRK